MKKDEKLRFQILNMILGYEDSKGHLKWRVSDVARRLKISRSLIYYHFGPTKEEMIETCYQMIAEEFMGLSERKRPIRSQSDLEKSLLRTLRLYLANPAIVTFFHRWRLVPSSTQKRILELERRYQDRLRQLFPHLDTNEILALHSLFFGIVTAPFSTPESVSIASRFIAAFVADKTNGIDGGATK